MRRGAPLVVLLVATVVLLGSYVVYTQIVVLELRRDAARFGRMYARVFRALHDPSPDAGNAALLDLARLIGELGVPVIVTDAEGRPAAQENLPFDAPLDDPRVAAYVATLDAENAPVAEPGFGTVHFGDSRLVRNLRIVPAVQAVLLALTLLAVLIVFRMRGRADRERVWSGMAREAAHQLGTPLSSLSGWIELLRDRVEDPLVASATAHMSADLERLSRVAQRFERIGRPPRRDPVDVGALADRVATYFRARVPTLAHSVEILSTREHAPLVVRGDAVLLEWALEAIVKNALDALAGRGGRIELATERTEPDRVRVRITDDGPGIPRELHGRIFEPGFSTKESGWGIGLSLARRIVEQTHGGRLTLRATDRGATFDIILHG